MFLWNDELGSPTSPEANAGEGEGSVLDRIHPDDRAAFRAAWREAAAYGEPFYAEARLRRRDGAFLPAAFTAEQVPPEGDAPALWLGLIDLLEPDAPAPHVDPRESMRPEEVARRNGVALEIARSCQESSGQGLPHNDLLSIVAHELRTPLNAIVGWTHMLRAGTLSPERQTHAVDVIARNAALQTQIISDLLDLSRTMAGKLHIDACEIDLADVLCAAMETVLPLAEGGRVRLRVEAPADGARVLGDACRLQQVVCNLLTNAIKFSPPGEEITVRLWRVGDEAVIAVRDHGEGIRHDSLAHVFDRFWQADASCARKHGGLGIGLSITRDLVALHGGTIDASSDGLGCGSTFTVRLPLASAQRGRDARAPLLADEHDLRGLEVLVVEDEADAREVVASLLEERGAIVREAANAADAFLAVQTLKPHVVISDIGMPGEDGLSLMRRIRALPPERGGSAVAIALSAYAREEDQAAAIAAGFDAHIEKPVPADRLVSAVVRLSRREVALAS
ncbi:ATP-binding protein [Polyangium aurulentum]|uniref:hybrid sensor histidine kinase/response regulator n=1 Tax=Polyangium aurulentum TaxID=2567896 RepID=UPI00146E8A96|nr:ATP-binding protein [Polyangium aurulentum]UQA55493.1 response regulator [Polyangium aurulentum]